MAMIPPDPYARRGPRIIPTGLGGAAGAVPGGGMTLDALMKRQQELAAAKGPQMPELMISPLQGIGYAMEKGLQGFQSGRAERQATEGRNALAQAMAQIDPNTGELPPEAMATLAALDPDKAFQISADLVKARRDAAQRTEEHGWDVTESEADRQAARDLAAQSQGATARENELNRAADLERQKMQDAQAAGNQQAQAEASQNLARLNAQLDEIKAGKEPAQAAAKIGAETEARRTEALRLGLKEGSDEFNNYVATGGSPQHVKTESEQLAEKVSARQAEAEKLGLKPGSQEYKDYTLTGQLNKMPASELQTISETDDKVHATDQYIQEMQSLITPDDSGLSINDRAYSGIGADTRTSLARNDPTGLLADKERGEATTKLKNIIGSEAISSLRAIFGSNPTEGERQVLMDMNASIDKSPAERRDIITRAVRLAKDRLVQLQRRSEQLRSGTYTQPGGGGSGDPDLDNLLKKYQ